MRSLLEWCFAALPADRPASMNEVVRVLFNKCGASASEASVVVAGDNTGRAGSLHNLGASLFEKAHDPARADTEQTADAGVLRRAVDAFAGASRLAAPGSVMCADARSMEGAVLLLLSEPAKAEASFEAAVRERPRHGRALFNLAVCRSELAGAAECAAADAMFVRAAETGEMQQSDLRAFVAPSADDASTDQAAAYLLWFLREHATLRDGVSGSTHAIDDVCVNLTLSEAKTREHASVALSGSEEPKGAWAGPAALAADALLPHGISLRCVRKRRGVRRAEDVLVYSYVCMTL